MDTFQSDDDEDEEGVVEERDYDELGHLSFLMLLLLNLRRLQEGDVARLLGTLQAPMLLATRVRVRLGGSDDDF